MPELPDIASRWNYGDPAATEAAFRAILPDARASGDLDYLAELLSQIARTRSLRRQFEPAHAILDEAEALGATGAGARTRIALERGRCHNSAGEPGRAAPLFAAALAAAAPAGLEYLAIDAAHMLGIAAPEPERLGWNLRALEMAESATDPRARNWLGPMYNNLAWTHFERGDYPAALEMQRRSEAYRLEKGQRAPARIARWGYARTLRALDRVPEAAAIQRALLESAQDGDPLGYVHEELGECALLSNAPAAAHFAAAHALLSQDGWLVANEPERLARLASLGGVAGDAG